MVRFIEESAKEFVESLGAKFGKCEEDVKDGYISKIEVEGDLNYEIFLSFPKSTLDKVSILLFEDEEYDLEDLLKEIANLIVGKAKVVASNKEIHFNISIPEFLDKKEISYDDKVTYSIDGNCFTIFIKGK